MMHRPLLGFVVLFSLGILMEASAGYTRVPFGWVGALAAGMLGVAVYVRNRPHVCLIFLCLTFLGLGIFYSHSYRTFSSQHIYFDYLDYVGKAVPVEGIVAADPQQKYRRRGPKTAFSLNLKRVKTKTGWQKRAGKILVNCYRRQDLSYGDEVRLQGKLHKPFDFSYSSKFSYRRYLWRKGIFLILSVKKDAPVAVLKTNQANPVLHKALNLRRSLKNVLHDHLSGPEAGLMQALLLGERTRVPPRIWRIFQQTGTAHILAISGLHVGIVAGIFFLLLKLFPLGRRWLYAMTILLLAGYILLTGMRPSVVRAGIMAVVFLTSFLLERETDGLNSLSLAAFIILLINPMGLFDIGFQLSFMSVTTIILLYPIFFDRLSRNVDVKNPVLRYLAQSAAVSTAAWVGVAGLIAYYFEIVTPITILANLIVVPLIGVIVGLGFGILIFGLAIPPLAAPFAACTKLALNFMVAGIYLINKIPGSHFLFSSVNAWYTVGYYILICLLLFFLPKMRPSYKN